MTRDGKFGKTEAVCLLTITMTSKVFFSNPAAFISYVGNSAWYATLISASVSAVMFYFIYLLLKRFEGDDLPQIFEKSMGRWAGGILSLLLALFLVALVTTRISETDEFLRVYVMPKTPNFFITGIFMVCIAVYSLLGIESMARFGKVISYSLLAGLILVLVLSVQNYDVNNLFPIFGYGGGKTLLHGVARSASYGEIIVIAIFATSFQGSGYIKKEGFLSIILSAVIVSACTLAYTLTYPYYTAREITAPIYEMTTLIDYGRFVQRVEAWFLYVWIISSFLSATVMFYAFVHIFCRVFKIEDKRPVIIGSAVIVYALSMMHGSIMAIINEHVNLIRYFGSIPFFLFPIAALVCAKIREKGDVGNA